MADIRQLSQADREFLSHLVRAAFVNPFSEERARVDELIGGETFAADVGLEERMTQFMPRVEAQFERMRTNSLDDSRNFEGEDRKLVEYAWLFYIYHEYAYPIDDLIQRQLDMGDAPVQAPFAKKILAELVSHGFSRADAVRFFELFYQIRRAYYFITKGLVGRSPSMQNLRRTLWNNIFTYDIGIYDKHLWHRMEDFSTLLAGETGVGKGAAAAATGRSGCIPFNEKKNAFEESFTRTFLSINLSQFSEGLIESELFGHRKGAFTGAMEDHEGVFERSSPHGALFLDEIGEVSGPVQIKLLQVLQERTFSPVGSHEKKRFEGRVIAATNRSLDALRSSGAFRDDFYYRLSSDIITVPPLRQRLAEDHDELDDLIKMSVERIIGETADSVVAVVRETLARDLPRDYAWPGNVRELEQAVRRILLTGAYKGEAASGGELNEIIRKIESGTLEGRELLARYCRILYKRFGSYEEVARRTSLDRRTVKKHINQSW